MISFSFYKQLDAMDCGPACLRMIARHYGKTVDLNFVREKCHLTREGVSLSGIAEAAESIGFRTMSVCTSYEKISSEALLPVIIHWKQKHFIIVYKIKHSKNLFSRKPSEDLVYAADPAHGLLKFTQTEFLKNWISTTEDSIGKGVAMLLEPTNEFLKFEEDQHAATKMGFSSLFAYMKTYKRYLVQLFIGLIVAAGIQLAFPLLTQSMVDFGIGNQNLSFIYLVLIAQLMLFVSKTVIEFIRNRMLLHISSRIQISVLSDFLIKLIKLPITFFDSKFTGDLLQRIDDNYRVNNFLASSTLNILFSFLALIVFSVVIAFYSMKIFIIFIICSLLHFGWILLFMRKRKQIDYMRFSGLAENQSNVLQLINGIREIKLNNCEKRQRWKWEHTQAKLFRINLKSLSIAQYQQGGGIVINEGKNIIVSFIAAYAVYKGEMTLGMMLAMQYMIGQMNYPMENLVQFLHTMQDAKLSMERLGDVHTREDEEERDVHKNIFIPKRHDIFIKNLNFGYEGPNEDMVLKNINMWIQENKVTAIVGASGSGKTTLLNLLLGFYKPTDGEIKIGDTNLHHINSKVWRSHCGAVMQDGYLFNDSIANNIAICDENVNRQLLHSAVRIANLTELIEDLPQGYNSKIGTDGRGLSQGQKQRILIARAVYKDPNFLFFDEATNALDASNEKEIMSNLDLFFKGRTVVVVAHRLSTVCNADQVIVLHKGQVAECGTHQELTQKQGVYYNLVKNQLELGQ